MCLRVLLLLPMSMLLFVSSAESIEALKGTPSLTKGSGAFGCVCMLSKVVSECEYACGCGGWLKGWWVGG